MQTGINRRQVILAGIGAILTALLCLGIYYYLVGTEKPSAGTFENSKVDLIGTWRVSPIEPLTQIRFISDGEAVLLREEGETKLYLRTDKDGLQLRRRGEDTPSGYFLFRELKRNTWQGLWGDDLVVLKRLSSESR
ncbi:hypothetical protein CH379_003155 [Leptospira ellisii]|uniref:TIGR03067 domain-containing protein n=1 Tax=Leptospira ellisii TaxID=2023197 RepID=A0A2N0B971_9LEPT|nr:hypothetical protein [Leptospira ellisii]MDV6234625.1 hypothetical protein [Leptospira ellisii]PJZ93100.1 hypothetical protein CH379_09540 [Leptospira ellisii]PKA06046.1 hypothetical protein CH375_01875 [Leptospira ellisii]